MTWRGGMYTALLDGTAADTLKDRPELAVRADLLHPKLIGRHALF